MPRHGARSEIMIREGSPLRQALRLNPMTHVMVMYQQVLFHGKIDHEQPVNPHISRCGD